MWAKVRQSFLAGLLVLLPVFITVQVLLFAFGLLDGVLGKRINLLLQTTIPNWDYYIPGVGLIVTMLLIGVVGYFTRYFFFASVTTAVDRVIDRIPVARSIYKASKQLMLPFTDQQKLPFSKVVLIEYPMPDRWTMGLLARQHVEQVGAGQDDLVVVFVPSNHLHLGYPVIMPRSQVVPLDINVEDAVKFFVSCGVILNGSADLQAVLPPPSSEEIEQERMAGAVDEAEGT